MTHRTLLLTAWYLPHKVLRWQDAVTMVFLDKVDVVAEYDVHVSSPSVSMKIPAVVRSRRAAPRMHPVVRFSRGGVFVRDRFTCQYCGRRLSQRELTLDHVTPRSSGGRTEWNNIVAACRSCNQRKGCLTCDEAGLWPIQAPFRPKCLPIGNGNFPTTGVPAQWEPYVQLSRG